MSKTLKFVLSSVLAGVLLFLAFRTIDLREFLGDLKGTRWFWIVMSVAAAVFALLLRAWRWCLQLRALDPEISCASVWHGSNVGNFLSLVIPGIGEFYRCAHVSTKKCGYDRTFGTIMVERAWDLLAVALLLGLALVLNFSALSGFMRSSVLLPLSTRLSGKLPLILAVLALLLVAAVAVIMRLRSKSAFCAKCAGILGGIVNGISAFGRMKGKFLFLVYTAGIWFMYILMTWFTFLAIPELSSLSLSDATFISAVGNIASVIPTPGNLGAYHYLVGIAISEIYLGVAGMSSVALLCATLSHGSHALLLLVLGLLSYFRSVADRK